MGRLHECSFKREHDGRRVGGLAQWYDFETGSGRAAGGVGVRRRGVVDLWKNPVEGATPIKQRMRRRQSQRSKL